LLLLGYAGENPSPDPEKIPVKIISGKNTNSRFYYRVIVYGTQTGLTTDYAKERE
jgi:hypothetical protein